MALDAVRRRLEPVMRRMFHVYWRFARGMTLGVRAVVLDETGRIFLVKHSYIAGWYLPGGGVEPGETALEALVRELEEEGGITVEASPELHGLFYNSRYSRRDHVAVYVVRRFRQQGGPRHAMEIIDHGFFAPESLPVDTTAASRARIAEVLNGAPRSERW